MVQVEVDSSEEGRVTGSRKQLQDEKVHEMLSEDVEAPPPPYSPPEGKASSLSPSSLSGDNILTAPHCSGPDITFQKKSALFY